MLFKGVKISITILATIVTVAFFAGRVDAKTPPMIVINEVYYDTSGIDSKEEWIELYNTTSNIIDISNYTIRSSNDKDFIIPTGITINPSQYFVVAKDKDEYKNLYFEYPDLSDFSINLANTGDFVSLSDSSHVEIDRVIWEKDFCDPTIMNCNHHGGVKTGHSIERIDSTIDTNDCAVDFTDQIDPSPKKGYVKILYSDNLKINEVVPKPENGAENEYVELFNTGDTVVDLNRWCLDDIEGGSSPYCISEETLFSPKQFIVFYKYTTSIAFNDSGDSVRLISPDQKVKDTIIYDKAISGQSYSKFESIWEWTMLLTPGEANMVTETSTSPVTQNDPPSLISICNARSLINGEKVKVVGVVVVLPGVLSKNHFYIQQDECGIQIYSYHKRFPNLVVGDVVEIVGELSEYYNEKRIKTTDHIDIKVVSHQNPIEPKKISTNECNEKNEGEVVEVEGFVTKTSGNTFWISGSKEIKIYIRQSTGIKKPKMRVGDRVRIVGIVSQYKDYYRILPYEQSGVMIVSSSVLPTSGSNISAYLLTAIVLTPLAVSCKNILTQKKKQKIPRKRLLLY